MTLPVRRVAVIAGAALLLALTACSAAPTPASTSGPAAGAPAASAASAGTAAAGTLSFAGATVDGGQFDAAELAGTPVVLWFWAPF